MKQRKLPSFIALSICLEMVLSPLAIAETQNQPKQSTGEKLMNIMNVGAGLYNNFRGQPSQPSTYMASDMKALGEQQMSSPDKYFTAGNLSKIPGLAEYIAKKNMDAAASGGKPINANQLECKTLPTTLFEAKNEVCRNQKVSMISGTNPANQATEAFAYYNQYSQIEKLYKNYSAKSNAGGQSFGVGCMADATQILNGFFAYRLEQMDTIMAEMEAATAKFVEQSEMDLKSIRESTAILGGENSKFATEFKNSDIFDYGKRFEDPACNSMFSKDDMQEQGKNGGLLGMEKLLKDQYTKPVAGSKYTPEQYLKKNADITNEIRKMADDVSKQAQLNFSSIANSPDGYGSFLGSIGGSVNTDSGAHNGLNKAFFSDLQTKFAESRKTLTNEVNIIRSELGNKGGDALALLSDVDNDSSFDAELTTLENEIKGECLNRSGVDTALSRIYDPTLSKEANKQTAAQVKKRIKAIIEDVKLSPERKLQELQAIESSNGNRYEMKMDANYETNEIGADGKVTKKTVNAASKVTPGGYFSDVIKNCETQYQVNKLNNKLSAKETIKKLRTLKKDYQKAAKQHSKDIKDEIVKKMIDCGGNAETQASSTVGSCSPEKLNMTSPGFCTKAAFSCSKNMQQCSAKAQNFVKQIKDDRLKRTNNYNNNVEANRKQLVGMFDNLMGKYMKEAESMRGMFGAGFAAPKGIERDIQGDGKFDPKFLGNGADSLEIKDPKQYLEMVKNNMELLKGEVKKQQDQIQKTLDDHMELTADNYSKIPGEANQLANACLNAYNSYKDGVEKQQQDMMKAQSELGEKNGELCTIYSRIMSNNPNGACQKDFADVGTEALKAAKKTGGNSSEIDYMIRQMDERCAGVGKESTDAMEICSKSLTTEFGAFFQQKFKKGTLQEACDAVNSPTGDANLCTSEEETKDFTVTVGEGKPKPTGKPKDSSAAKYKCADTWQENGTTTDGKGTIYIISCTKPGKADCSILEKQVVNIYNEGLKAGLLSSTSQATSVPATCSANNNSGPFNTKGGFPNMQNPVQQAAGAMGVQN